MESTAQTAGDFANTSDGMANQQRILAAEFENLTNNIGAGVLPMLTEVVGVATKVTGAFSSLSPEAQATAGRFAAITVAGIGLVGTISMVAGQVVKMRDRFTAADGTLNKFGKTARGAGIGVGVAAAAMVVFSLNAEAARRSAERFATEVSKVEGATSAATIDAFMEAIEAGLNWKDQGRGGLDAGIDMLNSFSDSMLAVAEASPAAALKVLELEDATGGLTAGLMSYGASAEDAVAFVEMLRTATDAQIESQRQAAAANDAAQQAIYGTTDAVKEQSTAVDEFGDEVAGTTEAVEELTDAFSELKQTISDENAYLDAVDGFDALRAAGEEAWTKTAEGATDAEEAQRDYQRAINDSKIDVLDLVEQLGNVPESTTAEIITLIDQGKVDEAELKLASLSRVRIVQIVPDTYTPRDSVGISGYRASGGPVSAGGTYVVGERGPELLQMGASSGNVVDARSTAAALSGGTPISLTVNAGMGADGNRIGSEIVRYLREWERHNGPGWRS